MFIANIPARRKDGAQRRPSEGRRKPPRSHQAPQSHLPRPRHICEGSSTGPAREPPRTLWACLRKVLQPTPLSQMKEVNQTTVQAFVKVKLRLLPKLGNDRL